MKKGEKGVKKGDLVQKWAKFLQGRGRIIDFPDNFSYILVYTKHAFVHTSVHEIRAKGAWFVTGCFAPYSGCK